MPTPPPMMAVRARTNWSQASDVYAEHVNFNATAGPWRDGRPVDDTDMLATERITQ